MKKLVFTAAMAVLGFTSVNAQDYVKTFGFSEGDVLVEGNFNYNSETETESDADGDYFEQKNATLSFNPKAGYFVSDKLAVGVQLSINSRNDEETDLISDPNFVTERNINTIGAGVFARYYFLELGERFKTYTEFGVSYISGNEETIQTGAANPILDYDISGLGAGLDLGVNYFVTENFAINFGLTDVLAYSSITGENQLEGASDEIKRSQFSSNLNVINNFFSTAQFGLTWKF